MHIEVLVEGESDLMALTAILFNVLGANGSQHSWRIHKYRGVGELPSNPMARPDPKNPTLLHKLPATLRGYGKSLQPGAAVLVLVDLDDNDCLVFKREMVDLLAYCSPPPNVLFRIAIEELEAWFLGDRDAILAAYPRARAVVLDSYVQDSICGTWEKLADAIYPGGARTLKKRGRIAALKEKFVWAKRIAPLMNPDRNQSESFRAFRNGVLRLVQSQTESE